MLAHIKNCEFVMTDSFHGVCFAIIFNKPFAVYINKDRGASRFYSLLKLLHLERADYRFRRETRSTFAKK